jgi:UDP-glucose 4-epimerase
MNCIVIGGGGFIGSHITEGLLRQGHAVVVFDRPGAPYLKLLGEQGATITLGNFFESSDLLNALTGMDVAFHFVSTTVPKTSNVDPAFDVQSNLVGTINFLNIAKDVGVKKVLFPSSGGTVYGIPQFTPITEAHPTNPISSYGITKLAIEKYLALFHRLYGLDYSILRISNAYGERQQLKNAQGLIPTIIHQALTRRPLHVWGDGSVVRDYVHASDIATAFLKVLDYEGETKIFNISSGTGYTVNQVIEMVQAIIGGYPEVIYDPADAYDVPVNILDNSRAKQTLDWSPTLKLEEGLRRTVAFMQEHL